MSTCFLYLEENSVIVHESFTKFLKPWVREVFAVESNALLLGKLEPELANVFFNFFNFFFWSTEAVPFQHNIKDLLPPIIEPP